MKLGSKLAIGIGVVLVAIVAAVLLLVSNLDSLVKKAIETVGPELAKVTVKVDKVTLSPTSGAGSIAGLVVGNPAGYKTPYALSLGEMRISVDPATIASDTVVIREVVIQSPSINYEQSGKTNNLDAIQHNVDESLKALSGGGKKESGGKQTKLIIENLYVRDGKVTVLSPLTLGKDVSAALPPIHLKDIGKKSGGASPAEVTKQVLGAITSRSGSAATGALQGLKEGASGAMDKVKGLFK